MSFACAPVHIPSFPRRVGRAFSFHHFPAAGTFCRCPHLERGFPVDPRQVIVFSAVAMLSSVALSVYHLQVMACKSIATPFYRMAFSGIPAAVFRAVPPERGSGAGPWPEGLREAESVPFQVLQVMFRKASCGWEAAGILEVPDDAPR